MARPRQLAILLVSVVVLVAGVAVARQAPRPVPPSGPAWPTGPVADDVIAALLKQFSTPGVSIAVIKGFAIEWAKGYGTSDVDTGAPVTTETMFQAASISKPVAAMASMKAVQDGKFTLDQDINTILKSWKLPGDGYTNERPVTPRTLMSHTSGTGDAFGFPGYAPSAPLPTTQQMLDGQPPSNRRQVRLERAPYAGFEYSGGGVMIQELALGDALGKPFVQIAYESVLKPIGMTNSTYEQPLPAAREKQAARAHNQKGTRMGDPWHVYPEHAAAGLWTTPTDLAKFLIEVQRTVAGPLAPKGPAPRVLSRPTMLEMVTPVGVGPFAVGFSISKEGEGWYFSHGGSNWGFQCFAIAHRVKGYGLVVMTNGDNGGALANEIRRRLQQAYQWDVFDDPVPRAYGPVK